MDHGVELAVRGDRVLIRPEDQSETTRGSLVIVQPYAPEVIGTIVAVGDRVSEETKPGDVVLFTKESGQVLIHAEQKYLVMHEDELLAVWNEENEPV